MDDVITQWKLDVSHMETAIQKAKAGLASLSAAEKKAAETNEERAKSGTKRAEEEAKGLKASANAAEDLGTQMMAVAAQQFALAQLKNVVVGIGGAFQEARDKGKELANEVARMRESLVSLASVVGGKADNEFIRKNVEFAKLTGLKLEDSPRFQEAFTGRAAAYEKNFAKGEFEKTQKLAAASGAVTGIDPELIGDFFGAMIPSQDWSARSKREGKTESESIQMAGMRSLKILQRGSGKNKTLTDASAKLFASLLSDKENEGIFKTPEELAGVISTIAEVHPEAPDIYTRKAVEGLRAFHKKEMAPILAEAGITKETLGSMSVQQQIEAFAPVLKRKAKEQNLTIQDVLEMSGFDERSAPGLAVLATRGVGEKGILKDRQDFAATITKDQLNKETREFQTDKDSAGTLRIAQANEKGKDLARGMARNAVDALLTDARAELKEEGKLDTTEANQAASINDWDPRVIFKYKPKYVDELAQDRATEILQRKAHALGIDRDAIPGGAENEFFDSKVRGTEEERMANLNRRQDAVQKAQLAQLERQTAALEKDKKQLLPAGPKDGPAGR